MLAYLPTGALLLLSCRLLLEPPPVLQWHLLWLRLCSHICDRIAVPSSDNMLVHAGWQEVFRTERLMQTYSPKFERCFRINYVKARSDRGAESQAIRFLIVDDRGIAMLVCT